MKYTSTKVVVSEEIVTYKCDLLFEDIPQEGVYAELGGLLVVSKKAAGRLPPDFLEEKILARLARLCGSAHNGFVPELLHKGIWMVTDRQMYCSLDVKKNHHHFFAERIKLDTRDDVFAYIGSRYQEYSLDTYQVFQDGRLCCTVRPKVGFDIEVNHPPKPSVVIDG